MMLPLASLNQYLIHYPHSPHPQHHQRPQPRALLVPYAQHATNNKLQISIHPWHTTHHNRLKWHLHRYENDANAHWMSVQCSMLLLLSHVSCHTWWHTARAYSLSLHSAILYQTQEKYSIVLPTTHNRLTKQAVYFISTKSTRQYIGCQRLWKCYQ